MLQTHTVEHKLPPMICQRKLEGGQRKERKILQLGSSQVSHTTSNAGSLCKGAQPHAFPNSNHPENDLAANHSTYWKTVLRMKVGG
jgi:hypothetical protein